MAGRRLRQQKLYTVDSIADEEGYENGYGDYLENGDYDPSGHVTIYLGKEGYSPPPSSTPPSRRRSMSVDYSAGVGGGYSPSAYSSRYSRPSTGYQLQRPMTYTRPTYEPSYTTPRYETSYSTPSYTPLNYEPLESSLDTPKNYESNRYETSNPSLYTIAAGAVPVGSSPIKSTRSSDLDLDPVPRSTRSYVGTYDSKSPLTPGKFYNKIYSDTDSKISDVPSTRYTSSYLAPSRVPARAASVARYTDIEREVDNNLPLSYRYPRQTHYDISKLAIPTQDTDDYAYVLNAKDISGVSSIDKSLLEKKIHDLRHDDRSLTALEDHLRRNRSSYPKGTSLRQNLSYHPLSDDELRRLGLKPGSKAVGVKINESLVAPEENDAVRRARSFYRLDNTPGSLDVKVTGPSRGRRDDITERDIIRSTEHAERGRDMKRLHTMQLDLFDRSRKDKLDTSGAGVDRIPYPISKPYISTDKPYSSISSLAPYKYKASTLDLSDSSSKPRHTSLPPLTQDRGSLPPTLGGEVRKGRNKPPSFAAKLLPKKIEEGGTIRFHCSVIGNPEPRIEWYRGSEKLKNDDKYYISCPSSKNHFGLISLEIRRINKEDAGTYSVAAKNTEGEVSCSSSLEVTDCEKPEVRDNSTAPQFIRDIRHTIVDVGHRLVMEAQAMGYPTPEFRWHKDSTLLKQGGHIRIATTEGITKLTIKHVQPEDEGVYFVTAENDLGKAKCGANVKVIDKEKRLKGYLPEPVEYEPDTKPSYEPKEGTRPWFVTDLQEQVNVHEGEEMCLDCAIDGDPKPIVSWYKGTRELQYSRRHRVASEGKRHLLQVVSTMPLDAGDYLVVAKNSFGKVQALCVVNIKPPKAEAKEPQTTQEVEAPPPEFVKKLPTATTVDEGDSVQIEVKVKEDKPAVSKVKVEQVEEKKPEKPSFKRKLKELVVKEGEPIRLEIETNGSPTPTISWFRNGEQIEDTSLFQFLAGDNKSAMVSESATSDMGGKITVKAKNDSGEVECSVDLIVEVEEPKDGTTRPEFKSQLKTLNLKQGDSATLEIEVAGEPTPLVTWFKDGEAITDTSVFKFMAGANKVALQIEKAAPEHQGRYTARAVNKNGYVECSTDIKVKITDGTTRPEITVPVPDLTVKEGDKVTLEVEFKGNPMPLPTWYKDDEQIIDTSVYKFLAGDGKCSLIIESATADMEGTYRCRATNKNGYAETSSVLAVEPGVKTEQLAQEEVVLQQELTLTEAAPGAPEPKPSPPSDDLPTIQVTEIPVVDEAGAPEFTATLEDTKAKVDSVAKLTVKVIATPEAKVAWFKDGNELKDGGRFEIYADDNSYNLEIYDLEMSDTGCYSCTASNDAGSMSSQCQLTVEGAASKEPAPVFSLPLTDIIVPDGTAARFDCDVEGSGDDIQVTWSKDGKKVKSSDNIKKKHKGNTFSLVFKAVEKADEGEYVATAANDAGSSTCSATLTLESTEKKKKKSKSKEEKEAKKEGKEDKKKKKDKEPEPEKKKEKKKKSKESEDQEVKVVEEEITKKKKTKETEASADVAMETVVIESSGAEGHQGNIEGSFTFGGESSGIEQSFVVGESHEVIELGVESGEETLILTAGPEDQSSEQYEESFVITTEDTEINPSLEETEHSFTISL